MRVSITLGLMFQLLQVRINPHTQTHIYTYNIIIIYIYTYIHALKRQRKNMLISGHYQFIHTCMHAYIHTSLLYILFISEIIRISCELPGPGARMSPSAFCRLRRSGVSFSPTAAGCGSHPQGPKSHHDETTVTVVSMLYLMGT